jgi:hypothetical protein
MPDWVMQLMGMAGTGATIYAAIRADIATLHERSTNALDTAKRAHERIDSFQHHR